MKLRHFNIMRLLYCLVLALPFVAILSRVIYVQSNKNAYQSYTRQEVANQMLLNQNAVLGEGLTYQAKFTRYDNQFNTQNSAKIKYSSISINWNDYGAPEGYNYDAFATYKTSGGNPFFYLYLYENGNNVYTFWNITNIEDLSFNFTASENITLTGNEVFYIYNQFTTTQTLDNVFEYSVNKFIDDNNFGRVNLFEWTTNLFFDDNQVNNMYVHFVNWYLNYVLLMSTTYILFLVLMWFVNYSRRLLERGMNYDW